MAAITPVQNKGVYSGAASSVVVHLSTNTVATDTLLAAFCLPPNESVISVTDTINGRWIQDSYASSDGGNVELWQCRGIQSGSASVTAIFSSASVGTNISEWALIWSQSPLDSWSQMNGSSASVTPQQVFPRTTGELAVIVGRTAASVSGAPSGWTALSVPGNTGFAAAYQVLAGSVVPQSHWNASGASTWAALEATFLPINSATVGAGTGGAFVNPLLQFPEVSVQISTNTNFIAPLPATGQGVWVDITPYVETMSIGPYGREHMLDRINSTQATITVNGRDGTFNSWNSGSFLYPYGLDPMSPVRIVASYNGTTSPIAYLYTQSFTPRILDSQNVEIDLECYDLLQNLSLAYLSGTNYASALLAGN